MSWKTIHTCRQWKIEVNEDGDYRVVNPDPKSPNPDDPEFLYYLIESGEYGQPKVCPEPSKAFPVPDELEYVDASGATITPDQLISGIIIKDGDNTVIARTSLTNAKFLVLVGEDGMMKYEDGEYHLQVLVIKDKNRFRNYDAYFGPTKPDKVRVVELEDLVSVS